VTLLGLLNATFGNAPELIIAFVALKAGLLDMVRASLIGAILANILLALVSHSCSEACVTRPGLQSGGRPGLQFDDADRRREPRVPSAFSRFLRA
jgi:hypothetical protein